MNDEIKNNAPAPKKELSMENRMLLAFILMGAVLFATNYFYKSMAPPPPKNKAVETKKQAAPAAQPTVTQPTTAAAAEAAVPDNDAAASRPAIAAQDEKPFEVNTNLYRVVFSNRGAVVRSWMFKKYTDHAGKPLELVNTEGCKKAGYPFSLAFPKQTPSVDLNQALYVAKGDDDGLGVTYEFSNGKVTARKTFRFQQDKYLAQVSIEVIENGAPLPHLIAWRGGFGDMVVQNASGHQHSIHYDLSDSKLITLDAKAAKKGPVTNEGSYSFAGLEDQFFAAVFLPNGNAAVETVTYSDTVPTPANPQEEPFVGTAVGSGGRNNFALYVGPKDIDILRQVNPKLENIVDFGWFAILAKPLFLAVHWTNDRLVHNYGWSIVLVTIIINMLLFPLKLTNMKSMKKMQALQPQIAAINDKYKNVGLRDPRKQQQNEEVMALYKKHGANPMGGCMPMLLQIPFFIAFWKVLSVSIEMRHANWLWVTDLSEPETLPIKILPILLIATQFLMQKMTPSTTADPNQQRMMMIMPLFMGIFFYKLPSGLVLYYLTGNLIGIAQQWFFNRTPLASHLAQPVPVAKKRNGRK